MNRRKVPKLRQTFTFQGMSTADMLLLLLLVYLGYKLASVFSGNAVVRLGGAFLAYFLIFPRAKAFFSRFPPGYFSNYVWWLSREDVLIPRYDESFLPLVVASHNEVDGDEGQDHGLEGEVRGSGQDRNLLRYAPYLDIVDGVVFLENGQAEVGLELRLPSVLFASAGKVEAQWRSLRNILHLAVGPRERARFYIEAVPAGPEILEAYRRNIRTSYALAKEIAEARVARLEELRLNREVLKWRAFLTLSFPVGKAGSMQFSERAFEEVLSEAKNKREKLLGYFRAGGFEVEPMDTQEVFALAWRWWNPQFTTSRPPQYLPVWNRGGIPGKAAGMMEVYQATAKEQIVSTYVGNYSPDVLDVGGLALTAVAIHKEPEETFLATMSRVLSSLPGTHLYLVVEYAHTPLDSIVGKLQSDHRKYTALAEGEGMRDVTAKAKLKEVEKAMDAILESGDQVYETSIGLVLVGRNYRDALALRERAISALSVPSRREAHLRGGFAAPPLLGPGPVQRGRRARTASSCPPPTERTSPPPSPPGGGPLEPHGGLPEPLQRPDLRERL